MGFLEEVNALTALDTPRKPRSSHDPQTVPDIAFAGDVLCFFEESQRLADFINVSEIHVLANSKEAFALWHAKFLRACEQADAVLAHAAAVYASGSYPSVFPRLGATKRASLDTIGVLMHRIAVANEFDSLSNCMLLEMDAELDACSSLLCELQEAQCNRPECSAESSAEKGAADPEPLAPVLAKLRQRIIPLKRRMQFLHLRVQSLLDRSSTHFPEIQETVRKQFENIEARLAEICAETEGLETAFGEPSSHDSDLKTTVIKTRRRFMGLTLASPPSTRKSIVPLRGLRMRPDSDAPVLPPLAQVAPAPLTPITVHRRMRSLSSGTEESYAATEASTESPFSSPETLDESLNAKLPGNPIRATITSTPLNASLAGLEEPLNLDHPPLVPVVSSARHSRLSRVEEEADTRDIARPGRPPSRIKPPTALRVDIGNVVIKPNLHTRPRSGLRQDSLPKPTPLSTFNRLSQQAKRSTSSLQAPAQLEPRLRARASMIPVANKIPTNKSASAIARQSSIPTAGPRPSSAQSSQLAQSAQRLSAQRLVPRQSMPVFPRGTGDYETPTRRPADALSTGSSLRVRPRQSMQF